MCLTNAFDFIQMVQIYFPIGVIGLFLNTSRSIQSTKLSENNVVFSHLINYVIFTLILLLSKWWVTDKTLLRTISLGSEKQKQKMLFLFNNVVFNTWKESQRSVQSAIQ